MKRVISIVLISCLLFGCGNSPDVHTPAGYIAYMNDPAHDFRKVIISGNMQYTVQLVTPEHMACKELIGAGNQLNKQQYKKRIAELKGYTFFLVKMACRNKEGKTDGTIMTDQSHAAQMEAYYDEAAAADLVLQSGNVSLRPATYHFENNYGLSPENTIMAGFETGNGKNEDLVLTFNDRYTNTPMVRATFSAHALSQIPNIEF